MDSYGLTDLIEVGLLQKIQDSFAAATRFHVLTSDALGQPVTRHSHPTPLCALLECETLQRAVGRPLDPEAARAWAPTPQQAMGLVNFVEPIRLDGHCLGSIEMAALLGPGDPPADVLAALGQQLGRGVDEVRAMVRESTAASADGVDLARDLLRSIAETLSDLCRRNADSQRRVRELSTLRDVSRLLTGTTDLQERLDLLTRITTEALGYKGCLIRLLDEAEGRLRVKSVHNLSRRYLDKGPVHLADSALHREVAAGGVVAVADMANDPRSLYPRECAEEGLRSCLCVALRSKGRIIGTIRGYTASRHDFTKDETRLFEAIANQAASAIENATLYDRALRAQALDRQLAAAAEIQRHLIPASDPAIPGFDIASRYIPYHEVGGDLFDFVPIQDQHLGIAVADVSGKGIPGAILMAATRASLRGHIDTVYAARDIVAQANRSLCRDIGEDQFVTLFYGALDTQSRRFTYCNAGHSAPLLFRGGQHCGLKEGGLVLGVLADTEYEEHQFTLLPGDVVVFYTDGLTETMSPADQTFGTPRLIEAVRPHVERPAVDILDAVCNAVRDFARGVPPRDDFTIIVLKVL